MKIVFIVTRADEIGGAEVHVRDLSEALLERGHAVTVLAGGGGAFASELARCRIPYRPLRHLVKPVSPLKDVLALRETAAALREIRPDLVAAHTAKAGFIGRLACGLLRIPAVFTPHGWAITDRISRTHGHVFLWMERLAGIFSDRIVNVCEFERALAVRCKVAPERKLDVIYNGMPDVASVLRATPGTQPPRLIMVARMARPKDHAILIDALAGIRDLEWTLDFIGEGPLEAGLRERVAALNLADRVHFLGFRTDVASQLAAAQVFVLTSRFEAFPYSTLEAMRAGLPLVASDVGGVREAVPDGTAGFLVPPNQVEPLRERLRLLLASPHLRIRMGRAARERYLERFTYDRMVSRTLAVYGQVLSERLSA